MRGDGVPEGPVGLLNARAARIGRRERLHPMLSLDTSPRWLEKPRQDLLFPPAREDRDDGGLARACHAHDLALAEALVPYPRPAAEPHFGRLVDEEIVVHVPPARFHARGGGAPSRLRVPPPGA